MSQRKALGLLWLVAMGSLCPAVASADNLYSPSAWSAMASDRSAQGVGDSITVIIYENSTAQNAAQTGAQKDAKFSGELSTGALSQHRASANLSSQFDNVAQASRSGRLVAQMTVVVDGILPNGDLHVAGQQILDIGGEKTNISVKGRLRPADISSDNTVLSTRLADASISYNGRGFVSRSAKPGLVSRVFNLLGLL